MEFASWPSGLANAWADAERFLAGVRFARPLLLWLAVWPVLQAILGWLSARWVRRRLARVGRPGAVAGLLTDRRPTGWLTRLVFAVGWSGLVLAVAGPRWGLGDRGGVAVGRDVILVIDLSRSMLAEDLTDSRPRWKAAVDAVGEILDSARAAGGHRIGLLVFAARPLLLVPLTTDYDHVSLQLNDLSGLKPPPEVRPTDDAVKSGTRIGAAVQLAAESHDPRFPGTQDILLFSDGDDPANDGEWTQGVTAARTRTIPIHVVGLGDPTQESKIPLGENRVVEQNGVVIVTRLQEQVLLSLAREGQGQYFPARRESPVLADFLSRLPERTRDLTDDAAPQLVNRAAGFYLAAFGLLLIWVWRAK